MAKAAGATVIATSRGADKAKAAAALGADVSLDARTDDLEARIKAAGSADVVLDMVGRDYADLNLNSLKAGGRWVVIASLTGPKVEMDLQRIMLKRLTLTGSTLRSRPADEKARPGRSGRGGRLALDRVRGHQAAHRRRLSAGAGRRCARRTGGRRHIGKIVLSA